MSRLFVDPIADIAVLGSPDNQELHEQAEAYERLVNYATPFAVADAPAQGTELHTIADDQYSVLTPGKGRALVMSLGGRWLEGEVERSDGWLHYTPEKHFAGGMSGSPILDATTGAAIGVCSVDLASPVIVDSLSAQLVRAILAAQARDDEIAGC